MAPPTKAISDSASVHCTALEEEQEFVAAEGTDHGVVRHRRSG